MPFLSSDDELAIVQAIQEAEKKTSGEVRVHIEKKCPKKDPIKRAISLFQKLGMHKTDLRNGVIVYVATEDHLLAIWGDEGIHTKVGREFWESTLITLQEDFKTNQIKNGLTKALLDIGEKLQQHFPYQKDDKNELDDSINYG
ncbi:MAG: TPM domain-containing protein [Bacteroidota bacterium]|nr:TPM domain-containing protein [Bacteroidota bacterium]